MRGVGSDATFAMMRELPRINFALRGEFAGFVRNEAGKRRLLLRTATGEVELKVPAELRAMIRPRLVDGMELVVSGVEKGDGARHKRTALNVEFPSSNGAGAACVQCPIQVCTKKRCWRGGGEEVWAALKHELMTAGLQETVSLESVHCLDNCKRGPNLTCQGELLEDVRVSEISDLVRHLAETPAAAKQALGRSKPPR